MDKTLRIVFIVSLVVVVGLVFGGGGFVAGYAARSLQASLLQPGQPLPAASEATATPASLEATFAPFWEAWGLVHEQYIDQPVDDIQLMQGAIRGMLQSLKDPHTSYMSPAETQIMSSDLSGEFEGIGAYVEAAGDYLRIVSPLPGSQAEKAGLLPGDIIVMVDGKDVAGLGEAETIRLVRGPAGSVVHLTIMRANSAKPLEFDVTRAKYTIASVESKMLDSNIAYVKINDFGQNTTQELQTALKTLMSQKPAGLVLDLRGNPGGYLDTGIMVASQFIPNGVIVTERYSDGSEQNHRAVSGGLATKIPLVVLIDQGSASASEIVAGAIQDDQRGQIVGETSYGKGSVQNVIQLQGDNGTVRITVAHWLTPKGRLIDKLGITPDVPIERTADDITADRDPQLDAAVKLLLEK
jgi:carboxyl-terminal processing protease